MGDWVGDILSEATFGLVDSPTKTNAENQRAIAQQGTDAALTAQREALQQQRDLYDKEIARQQPYYNVGTAAIPSYQQAANEPFNYNYKESPSAKFALERGTRSLNRQLAARGLLGSGNAALRLAELESGVYANDYDTGYNRAFNEYNNKYGRLLDSIKIGTGAAASAGNSSQTLSGQIGQSGANQSNTLLNSAAQLNNINQQQYANQRSSLYGGAATALSGVNAYLNYRNSQPPPNRGHTSNSLS